MISEWVSEWPSNRVATRPWLAFQAKAMVKKFNNLEKFLLKTGKTNFCPLNNKIRIYCSFLDKFLRATRNKGDLYMWQSVTPLTFCPILALIFISCPARPVEWERSRILRTPAAGTVCPAGQGVRLLEIKQYVEFQLFCRKIKVKWFFFCKQTVCGLSPNGLPSENPN